MATISERLRENADFVGREDTRKTVNEAADTIDALVAALEFYADPKRYEGANQRPLVDDKYTPEGMSYRLDVTRDHGDIARAALARAKG